MQRRQLIKNLSALSILSSSRISAKHIGEFEKIVDSRRSDDPIDYILFYPTYIKALYFDGTEGPNTGIIFPEDLIKKHPIEFNFWHGHFGKNHQFRVEVNDLRTLKRFGIVNLMTTEVDQHVHDLFIDPGLKRMRVPGEKPKLVPIYSDDLI